MPMTSQQLAEKLNKKWEEGRGSKGTLENNVQEYYDFFNPSRSDIIFKDTLGSKRHERVFVNYGEETASIWARGLLNGIFPTATVFHEMQLKGVQKQDLPDDVIAWFEDVTRLQFDAFVSSNSYNAMLDCFMDEGVAGTSCCYVGESTDPEKLLMFKPYSIEFYEIVENNEGVVDTVVVKNQFTPYQLGQQFGEDNIPEKLKKSVRDGETNTTHDVFFGVMPNPDYNPTKARGKGGLLKAEDRPYRGIYYLEGGKDIIVEEGFYELPFVVTRVGKNHNERYGRGPAARALHSVKMLNQQAEYNIVETERLTHPPYLVNHNAMMAPINPQAGAITPINASEDPNPVKGFPTTARVDIGFNLEDRLKADLDRIFMRDVFITLEIDNIAQPNITAYQLQQVKAERLAQLGPVLKVNEREKITPIMNRIFGMLLRRGMLPDPPESIQGLEFEVKPTSPLFAAAAAAGEVEAMNRTIQHVAPLAQVQPNLWDRIDLDQTVKLVSTFGSSASSVMRSEEEVKKIREERAQREAQQAEVDQQIALAQAGVQQ